MAKETAIFLDEDDSCTDDAMEIDEPNSLISSHSAVQSWGEPNSQPLSDEWFTDLDESIDTITNTFHELRVSKSEPDDHDYVVDAERSIIDVQNELLDCLEALQKAKRRLRSNDADCEKDETQEKDRGRDSYDELSGTRPFFAQTPDRCKRDEAAEAPTKPIPLRFNQSPGEKVMKQLFRWWRPCGPGCVRNAKRLDEARITEVDGRFIQ